jgi:chemotaxis protein CheY-P-specific phosphatase CheC
MFGQALLLLSENSALSLVDWIMDKPPGTAKNLGLMERSALGEFGNLAVSHFLNALVSFSRLPSRLQPSPPAVMVDMTSAILSLVAMPVSVKNDRLLIVRTDLRDTSNIVQARFWILPDPQIVQA